MKQLFSLGPSELDVINFKEIENSSNTIKPRGGIWATVHHPDNPNFNEWVEYLTRYLYVLFYKYSNGNPFKKNGIILNISDDANIFYLRNYQDFLYLQSSYPHANGFFDYKAMKDDFDGLFVDLFKIYSDNHFSIEQKRKFEAFAVNSFILFNPNHIESYQNALVEIEPFDYEDSNCYVSYKIKVDPRVKKLERSQVLKRS